MHPMLTRMASVIAATVLFTAPVLADVQGIWLRAGGAAKIKIEPCGDSLCGFVVWLRDPKSPSKIGERVLYDMKASGANNWAGAAYNPEDGRNYSGKMELAGNSLVTTGCALGGMICRSVNWTRSR